MLRRALYTGRSGIENWYIALPRWHARYPSVLHWRCLLPVLIMAAFRDRLRGLLFCDGVVLEITQQIVVGQGSRGGYRFDRSVGGINPFLAALFNRVGQRP